MKRAHVYLLLAIAGAVVPYLFFFDFFRSGSAAGSFVGALFANGAAGGFTADLLITSVVFWILLAAEARTSGVRRPWTLIAVNLFIGLSCAFPLFLFLRERARAAT